MLTILLVSTADTELLAAAASGAGYLTANPARIAADDVTGLAARADLVVLRLLGGRKAWPQGVAALTAALAAARRPLVALGGEASPDAELMALSTVPAGVATETLAYLREGGPENLRELARFLSDTVFLTGEGFGGHARGHRGQRHQLGVRAGLAAQGDQRPAGGGQRGGERRYALRPGLPAAEEPEHHQVGPGRQPGRVVRRDPGRVGGQVAGAGGRGREQFGVGGGNQENGEHSPILPCSATANSGSTHRRRTGSAG